MSILDALISGKTKKSAEDRKAEMGRISAHVGQLKQHPRAAVGDALMRADSSGPEGLQATMQESGGPAMLHPRNGAQKVLSPEMVKKEIDSIRNADKETVDRVFQEQFGFHPNMLSDK